MTYCEIIASQLGGLFICSPHDTYVRIRTPFLYPDGDVIDLFVREKAGSTIVTDLGESLRWLKSQTVNPRRTARQQQLLNDVCATLGLELYRGMLILRVTSGTSLADAIVRVGQGCLRAADLWFTHRTRALQSTTDEVAEFLDEHRFSYVRNEKQLGRSGRSYTINFHVFGAAVSSLVFVLASASRANAKTVVEHSFTAMKDLSHLLVQHVALVDDNDNVWTDADLALLRDVSTVARWAEPQSLVDALHGSN